MKKIMIVFVLCFVTLGFSQDKLTEFQVGFLIPDAAKTGFIGGISMGRMVDENIGWAFEVDYFNRTYTKDTRVKLPPVAGAEPEEVTREIENSTTMVPVFFKLVFNTAVAPKLDMRFSGGVGYEFLWNSEINYVEDFEDSRFYSGFAWQVGAGVSLPISRAADLWGEAVYHGGAPSRDQGETANGLPIWSEINMSGLMFRAGIRLYTFGF